MSDFGRCGLGVQYYIWRVANYLDVRRMVYNLVILMLIICWPGATNPALLSQHQLLILLRVSLTMQLL
jgi:hypothetical protein